MPAQHTGGSLSYNSGTGGSGGVGLVIPQSAAALLPFADNAAREVWANANLSDLIFSSTLVQVGAQWYVWRGESNPAGPVVVGDWLASSLPAQGPIGVPGVVQSLGAGTNTTVTGTAQIPVVNVPSIGVASVTAGTNVANSGTAADPVLDVSSLGVESVSAGTNTTVTGTASAPVVNAADTRVRVSANDTTPGDLASKLVAGANVTIAILNEGGNEQAQVNSSGGGGGGGGITYVPPISGRDYLPEMDLSSENQSAALVADTLYLVPAIIRPGVYSDFGVNMPSLTGTVTCRVGLYRLNSSGVPSELIVETGDIALSNAFQSYFGAAAFTSVGEEYALGILTNAACSIAAGGIGTSSMSYLGTNTNFNSRPWAMTSQSVTTGWTAMPDPLTDTIVFGTPTSDRRPIVFVRAGVQT